MSDDLQPRDRRRRHVRRRAASALLLLLAIPASDSLALVRWNLHVWGRLRRAGRAAPDADREADYRRLIAHLPPRAVVGLVHGAGGNQEEASRFYYFLQYALAPRQVVLTTDADFVIAIVWPADGPDALPAETFARVAVFDSGLRLYRRIAR